MVKYLSSEVFCNANLSWSDAFASRLRESIRESDILGFIATEMKADKNCARVWLRINKQLSSADVKTARMMAQWSELFGFRCENIDSFLSFYSKMKGLIHKLKTNKSVAITDDIFLKA